VTDKKLGGKEQVHGGKIKANAELCVIRKKSVSILVNREFSILIPVNHARHPVTISKSITKQVAVQHGNFNRPNEEQT